MLLRRTAASTLNHAVVHNKGALNANTPCSLVSSPDEHEHEHDPDDDDDKRRLRRRVRRTRRGVASTVALTASALTIAVARTIWRRAVIDVRDHDPPYHRFDTAPPRSERAAFRLFAPRTACLEGACASARRGRTVRHRSHRRPHEELSTSRKRKQPPPPFGETEDGRPCAPSFSWMTRSFPNCNSVHEIDLADRRGDGGRWLGNGHFRDAWEVREDSDRVVLKTLRIAQPFDDRNDDRHRRDALVSDRAAGSSYVVDAHAYCSNAAVVEFGGGGDLESRAWPNGRTTAVRDGTWSSTERLAIAFRVARSVADLHALGVAHTDVAAKQYVLVDGTTGYKLNDFNRSRLIGRDETTGASCKYRVGKNPGKYRSPEEYRYEPQDEKVDVYSVGNVLYGLLTGLFPFADVKTKRAQKEVANGGRPPIPDAVLSSNDPVDKLLHRAVEACFVHDPVARPSARAVADLLEEGLRSISAAEDRTTEEKEGDGEVQ